MRAAILLTLALSACSPGMHRAYQNTMAGVSIAGWGAAGVMTIQALEDPSGNYRETRPMMGMSPRSYVVASQLINLAVVAGIRFMPDGWFDEHTPIFKDALLTMTAALGAFDAYNDYVLTR